MTERDDIDAIARALHGRRQPDGGWLCRCPVPSHGQGHGDRSPSLSLRQGDARLLLHCFAGCDARDVLAELERRGLLDKPTYEGRSNKPSAKVLTLPSAASHEPDPEAESLWRSSTPIPGTLAADYLAGRGLALDVAPSLRFLPSYLVGGRSFPAMLAAVQAADRRVVAVQLTFLDPATARKAAIAMPRKTIGALGGGAVRLGPPGAVLGLAEGTESAIGAMKLAKVPTWATLGGKRMHRVVVPAEVRAVHIFADDDPPGHDAARRAAEHHRAQGREVAIRLPAEGMADWADWACRYPEGAAA
jgi:hypothetical protein